MKRKVYIETSIPSFYYEVRTEPEMVARREITRRWWATERRYFDLFTSATVMAELLGGDFPGRENAIKMMEQIPLLQVTPDIDNIVSIYAKRTLMPSKNLGDAYHLALASYYEVDYLLTWNCRHLANVRKQEHVKKVNEELGMIVPKLITPEMLFSEFSESAI
jgi:predicted nucleic acid-binding protein